MAGHDLRKWSPEIFASGFAVLVVDILVHQALSGQFFWSLLSPSLTTEALWTGIIALFGFVFTSFGLSLLLIETNDSRPSSQPRRGQ